jgi:hypothetical protein
MTTRTLAAVALVAALSACSAQFAPVAIFEICAPPDPDSSSGACLYPATCDASLAGSPRLDVTTAQVDFRLPVQLNNSLVDNSSAIEGRINTNDAFIQSFEMAYTGAALNPVTIDAAVTVPADGSAGALLPLIPQAYFAALAPPANTTTSILVNVRGHGKLTSQDSFTTAWFQVPVVICAGCLAGDFCPGQIMASCPGSALGATSPGQTASVICIAPAQ